MEKSEAAVAAIDHVLVGDQNALGSAGTTPGHRVRGEILLKQNPADPAPAEEAYLTAIGIAQQQKARSFELRAALALAKLYQSTARLADAHAVLAPALEGFAPTPEMAEIGEAHALVATLEEMDEVKAAVAQRKRRLHLQTAYGHAMMWSTGFASEETKAAFARATELATGSDHSLERLVAAHGQWVLATVRGELRATREQALTFLREAEEAGRVMEACVVHRSLALISYFSGDFAEAGSHCEQALAACEPEWDLEVLERFGDGISAVAMSFLALTAWQLGDVERARELIESANRRAAEFGHGPSMTTPLYWKSYFEILRGDASAALTAAEALEAISRDQGMSFWGVMSKLNAGWARGRFNNPIAGAAELQQGLTAYANHGATLAAGFYTGLLAELEAETLGAESALSRIDEALALALQVDHRSDLAFLHRLRGDILLKRDPNNPAPAEEAFQTAITIARQQGARSHGLKTALALAKLYQSTNRLVDGQAVLAPALEGFSPTPEMPEIAEAQALLAALSQSDEVKAEAAQRQRLTQLHVAYGNALIAVRGYGAPETTEAFARARESAHGDKDAPERLSADYGLWVGSYARGELPSMRAHSAALLGDVEARPDSPEAGVAHRAAGITCWVAGEYREARDHLERALALFQPGRDNDLAFRFGLDPGVAAMFSLAVVLWPLREVDRAVSLVEQMLARIADLTHVGTLAVGRLYATLFDLMRGDRARAALNALELARLAREHDLSLFRAYSVFLEGWVTAASDAFGSGLADMRRGVELLREQKVLIFDGLIKITLAEGEARAGDLGRAVAILDEALATADRTGYRAFEAELHRVRGELLLKRDPANPAPAEEAFLTAIAVAKQQETRGFELRAALALAKLYQSTGRPARCALCP